MYHFLQRISKDKIKKCKKQKETEMTKTTDNTYIVYLHAKKKEIEHNVIENVPLFYFPSFLFFSN